MSRVKILQDITLEHSLQTFDEGASETAAALCSGIPKSENSSEETKSAEGTDTEGDNFIPSDTATETASETGDILLETVMETQEIYHSSSTETAPETKDINDQRASEVVKKRFLFFISNPYSR